MMPCWASLIIPSAESIGYSAFEGCENLNTIVLSNNLSIISDSVFEGCTRLKSVTIPSAETIGSKAFAGCTNLDTIYWPEELENLGHGAFQGCTNLKNVSLPNSLKRIYGFAFSDCTGLSKLTISRNVTTIEDDAFNNCSPDFTIDTPDNCSGFYFANRFNIPITHEYGEWQVINEATETEDGLKEKVCDNCGQKEQVVIPRQGKDYDEQIAAIQSQLDANITALEALNDTFATEDDVAQAIAEAQESIATAQAAIDAAQNANVADIAEELEAAKAAAETADANTLAAAKAYTNTALADLQSRIEAQVTALEDGAVAENSAAIAQTASDLAALQATVNALDETYAKDEDIAGLQSELADMKTEYTNAIGTAVASLQEQINSNKEAIELIDASAVTDSELMESIEDAKTAIAQAQSAIDAAQDTELGNLATALTEAKTAAATANTETLAAAKAYTDLKCGELETQLKELKAEMAQNSINSVDVNLNAKASGETGAALTWNTSKMSVAGNKVKYTVFYKASSASSWTKLSEAECKGDGKAMTYNATGLTAGATYQFYVVPSMDIDEVTYTGSESLAASVALKKAAPAAEPAAPKVVKGKTYKAAGQTYKVTKVAAGTTAGTVTFIKAKNAKIVTVPATVKLADSKTYTVNKVGAKAFTAKKVRSVTIGKNVAQLSIGAFSNSKATKMVIKTKLLKKAKVKGSLRGSKIKTVKVKVGSGSVNKKFVKKYKKMFTKKNAGRKVTVK